MWWTACAPDSGDWSKLVAATTFSGSHDMEPMAIGLDLAKQVFQVHGMDRNGQAVLRKRLRRNEILPVFSRLSPCLVGLEACSTAHY
jgi:hypothetical protein